MKEILLELLKEYQEKFNQNKTECLQMIKNKEPDNVWQEHAKKGSGLKLMIETTLLELKRYEV